MTASRVNEPGSLSDNERPFAPRTKKIVGREKFLRAMREAITDETRKSHVLYFTGPGGIGKTRLLEEVGVIRDEDTSPPFLWSGIIDLYHSDTHTNSGIEAAIIQKIDPDGDYFADYKKKRSHFDTLRRVGAEGASLEEERQRLTQAFLKDYKKLTQNHRVVLTFDTLELIQNESDFVQKLCEVEDEDTQVKTWLIEQICAFPNTVTLFAGRPTHDHKLQNDFKKAFSTEGIDFREYPIKGFTREETNKYLDAMVEKRSKLGEILRSDIRPDLRTQIFRYTGGRPIYLSLTIDLLLAEVDPDELFQDDSSLEAIFVEKLTGLSDDVADMLHYMVCTPKGLNAKLLAYLTLGQWSEEKCLDVIERMRKFSFVKEREGTDRIFLHDEFYAMLCRQWYNKGFPKGMQANYDHIVTFLRNKQNQLDPRNKKERDEWENTTVELLYYEMHKDPGHGYWHCFARWDEEAIRSHETGFDIRMRDEVLRFLNQHTKKRSPLFSEWMASKIDRDRIDRDSALRWVKRYVAQGRFEKARRVAKELRNSDNPAFDWSKFDDPLYKAGLLTIWGEAMLYTGALHDDIHSTLTEAIQLLGHNHLEEDDEQSWWHARIVGRAHNNIGYLHWNHGHYGLAQDRFRHALPFFEKASIEDELADTRNNLSYTLALLGRVDSAEQHCKMALEVREKLGRKYPIALSYNTLGRIYTLQDHPDRGKVMCTKARNIAEDIGDPRAKGLAYNALGFTLRLYSNQWKSGIFSPDDAQKHFGEAEGFLARAAKVFSSLGEPIRLWETYNELGSLYCDWGWLTRKRQNKGQQADTALKQYEESIKYQGMARKIAEENDFQFQLMDGYDDLAQVHGDRGFLFYDLGKPALAEKNLEIAQGYLGKVFALVDESYRLRAGEGFIASSEPGEAFWLALGKAHLQQAIWKYRQLKRNAVPDKIEAEEDYIRQFALATAYFQQFWPQSRILGKSYRAFARRLARSELSANTARSVVEESASTYKLDLRALLETIDDILGV